MSLTLYCESNIKEENVNKLLITGKYLDQPRFVGKFSRAVPTILTASAGAFVFQHVRNTEEKNKCKEFIKSICVFTATIGSALVATRGIGKMKGLSEKIDFKELTQTNTKLVNEFLNKNTVSQKTRQILEKVKTKILKYNEVKTVFEEIHNQKQGKELLGKLIPDPENIDSKHIFSEIGRLSVMGLVPVLGGIAGGVVGDRLCEKDWKKRIPDKIKEGSYQYLANIFLCNVGAGAALAILEKMKITSKSARATGMIAGILAFGVIGGSVIANLIGKACIDPFLKGKSNDDKIKGLYSERKPEALDIGLHLDDIATVAVLSGLKWIEPALPILYSISGYRAGIGYRNGEDKSPNPNF